MYVPFAYPLPKLHRRFWIVGSEARIYRYDDVIDGITWVTQTCDYTGNSDYELTAVWAVDDLNVYIIGWNNSTGGNVFIKTTDGGHTWVDWIYPTLNFASRVTCIVGLGDYIYVGFANFSSRKSFSSTWQDRGFVKRYTISTDTWDIWFNALGVDAYSSNNDTDSIVNNAYDGGVYDPINERIYFVPYSQSNQAKWHFLDCKTKNIIGYASCAVAVANAYIGGVYDPIKERIYFVPYTQSSEPLWHYLNCFTQTIFAYEHDATVVASAYGTGVYDPIKERIYFVPVGQILQPIWHYIDCNTGNVVEYEHGATVVAEAYWGSIYDPINERIYFTPYGQSAESIWHYIDCNTGNVVAYEHGATTVEWAYQGGVYDPIKERIYFTPYGQSAGSIWHYIDCNTGNVVAYEHGATTVDWAYWNGVYDPIKERIYFIPVGQYNQPNWHYIDCNTGNVVAYIHGATISDWAYNDFKYDPINERIYGVPHNESDEPIWHYIDCATGNVVGYEYGITVGAQAYWGSIYDPINERIYFTPYGQSAESIWHYIDCTSQSIVQYTHGATTVEWAYWNGVYDPIKERIYFVPYYQSSEPIWHYIDCNTGNVVEYEHGATVVAEAYSDLIYDPILERLYFVPYGQSAGSIWHYIDCNTGNVVAYTHGATVVAEAYLGGAYDPINERIYFAPSAQSNQIEWHYIDCATGNIVAYENNTDLCPSEEYPDGYQFAYNGAAYDPVNARIYFCPNLLDQELIWHYIDCITGDIIAYEHELEGLVAHAFERCVYDPDTQRIHFIPFAQAAQTSWVYLACSTSTFYTYSHGISAVINAYTGGAYDPINERIYFSPYEQSNQLVWHYLYVGAAAPLSMFIANENVLPCIKYPIGFFISGYNSSTKAQLAHRPDMDKNHWNYYDVYNTQPYAGHFIHKENTFTDYWHQQLQYLQPADATRTNTHVSLLYWLSFEDDGVDFAEDVNIYLGKFAPGDNAGGGMQLYGSPGLMTFLLGTSDGIIEGENSGDFIVECSRWPNVEHPAVERHILPKNAFVNNYWGPNEKLGGAIFGLGSDKIRLVLWSRNDNQGCYVYDINANTWTEDTAYTALVTSNFKSHAIHGVWTTLVEYDSEVFPYPGHSFGHAFTNIGDFYPDGHSFGHKFANIGDFYPDGHPLDFMRHRISVSGSTGASTGTVEGIKLKNVWNEFDEHGLLVGINRLIGEKNWEYRRRLYDVFVNRANSSYRGLVNGITRELGLALYYPLSINPRIDEHTDEFMMADPYIKFDGSHIYLYSDYANDQLDYIVDRYIKGGNFEHLTRLVDFINTYTLFEASINAGFDPYLRSMTIVNQSNRGLMSLEDVPQSTRFQTRYPRIIKGSVYFSDYRTFASEVTALVSVVRAGQYYIDYLHGIIYTYNIPPLGTAIRYEYYIYPFQPIASDIILYDINSDTFKNQMFTQVLQDNGTYIHGLSTEIGTDIINELFSVVPMYWGI